MAAVAILAALLAGCGSLSTPAPSFSALFNSARSGGTASSGGSADQPDFECPDVSIRAGASTMNVSANVSEDSATNLRYQIGIGQTARECRLTGNTVTMKIGVHGRVILGPAGVPGQVDLPIRLAVVHEGPDPKTILTKLNRLSVTIPPGEGNVQFTMIEDEVSFPMPRRGLIDEYIVYVGFDPQGTPARRPPPRASRRPAG